MPKNFVSCCFFRDEEAAAAVSVKSVAHVWWDYVPDSFVEPHSFLSVGGNISSSNLASVLWNNGKLIDAQTFYLSKLNVSGLIQPSLLFRVYSKFTRLARKLSFNQFLKEKLRKIQPDIVHTHFGTTASEVAQTLHQLALPHVVTLYGYDASAALRSASTVKKYQQMFKLASKFIVLCEVVKSRLIKLGCPPHKIIVWNMPAGVENYPLQNRQQSNVLRLIMAARFVEAKGHVFALRAISKLVREGHEVHLTMLGYGNNVSDLEKEIRKLNLWPNVTIINNHLSGNFVQQYRELLSHNDLYLLPSICGSDGVDEAGPALTMICAQSSGLPVICTPFPGSEISLIESKTGFFCEEKSSDSIAEQITKFIKDRNLLKSMGRAGSNLVNQEFSEWTQMEKLTSVYIEAKNATRVNPSPIKNKDPEIQFSESEKKLANKQKPIDASK